MKDLKNLWKSKGDTIMLVLSILLCLVSVIGASVLQTAGGTVKVQDLTIETSDGTMSLIIFKPKSATKDNPVPAVIASHGMFNSKEMQDIACVELSRRGVVVVAMDMVGHGLSDNVDIIKYVTNSKGQYYNVDNGIFVNNKADATGYNAHGMIDVVEYVWHNLDFVDKRKIGVTGHSMGGVNSTMTTKYYHYTSTVGDGINKINAAFFQACNEAVLPGEFDGVHVGYENGLYDEMFSLPLPAFRAMGITTVPELNQFQADTLMREHAGYKQPYVFGTHVFDQNGFLRVYNALKTDHAMVAFSIEGATALVDFFTTAFRINSNLPNNGMAWMGKELFNLVGLFGFFMFVLAFIGLLLKTPFFGNLKANPTSVELTRLEKPKTQSKSDCFIYVFGIVILAVLPGLLFYPFMNLGWIKKSALFPQSMTNNIALWVLLIGVILLAYMSGVYLAYTKRRGATLQNYGFAFRIEDESIGKGVAKMVKTIFMGVLGIMAGYFLLYMLYNIFKADFRFFSLAVKLFTIDRIPILLSYLVFFLIWSFGLTWAVNSNFRKGMSEWKVLAITIAANVLGTSIGLFTYYIPFVANGVPPSSEFINPILLMPIPAIVAIAIVYVRSLYKKTGSLYLAAVVNAILICFISIVNTHVSYPHWFI